MPNESGEESVGLRELSYAAQLANRVSYYAADQFLWLGMRGMVRFYTQGPPLSPLPEKNTKAPLWALLGFCVWVSCLSRLASSWRAARAPFLSPFSDYTLFSSCLV
jgi:hypothetical protein